MLLDYLHGDQVVAIIGLTKNTGKTTTFNHLVRQAIEREIPVGMTSIGRNGEQWDAVTRERKPLIWAPEGAWVATAAAALDKSTVRLDDPVAVSGSSFGPILLGRVAVGGHLELIGPQTGGTVAKVTGALREAGAALALVDGTFGRRFTAAANLSDGLVIATGATAGNTLESTVQRTRYLASLFRLPPPPAPVRPRARAALNAGQIALLTSEATVTVPFRTALGNGEALAAAARAEEAETVVLPGALTNGLADDLTRVARPLAVVVADPACLLLDGPRARRLADRGITLHPMRMTALRAVTVNPHGSGGHNLLAEELRDALQEALAPVPVVNVADEGAILSEYEELYGTA